MSCSFCRENFWDFIRISEFLQDRESEIAYKNKITVVFPVKNYENARKA